MGENTREYVARLIFNGRDLIEHFDVYALAVEAWLKSGGQQRIKVGRIKPSDWVCEVCGKES
jgi:hypothetical protein